MDVFYIEIDQGKTDNREYKIELVTEEYDPFSREDSKKYVVFLRVTEANPARKPTRTLMI